MHKTFDIIACRGSMKSNGNETSKLMIFQCIIERIAYIYRNNNNNTRSEMATRNAIMAGEMIC